MINWWEPVKPFEVGDLIHPLDFPDRVFVILEKDIELGLRSRCYRVASKENRNRTYYLEKVTGDEHFVKIDRGETQ